MQRLIPKWLEELRGVLESVTRLSVVVTSMEIKDEKIGRKNVRVKTCNTINHNIDYKFDYVVIVGTNITAKGKVVVIKIPENYKVESISLLNQENEKVYNDLENIDFPYGGTFTFSGVITMDLNFT